jgi:MtrB/PioB family decaheme-associated outer membrane protein
MKSMRSRISLIMAALMLGSTGWSEMSVSGEVVGGQQFTNVSSNEAKFEKYGEVPNGVVIPQVQLDLKTDHDQMSFEGTNVMQNNQSYEASYNHDYKFKVEGAYDQTPHNYSNTGQTLYNQSSPGHFVLPSQIQSNFQAQPGITATNFNNQYGSYLTAAHNANLQTMRTDSSINMGFRPSEQVKMNLGFTEDRIEGNKPRGATFGFNQPVQLSVPVEYKTYNMNAGSQYTDKNVQVGFNYLMSAFENDIETLTWANPKRLTDSPSAPAQGQMSLAPDNWSHTLTMNAGANLPVKTRFTAEGSFGYMYQNQDLLPYTDNTAATSGFGDLTQTSTLPETSANAKMLTWTQDYALTNRIVKPVTLGVRYHSYQLVNRTSEVTFSAPVNYDTAASTGTHTNSRFEFRKDTLEGTVDYQILKSLAAGVSYGTQWDHRIDRETINSVENTLKGTMDFIPLSWASLRGTYIHALRQPKDYENEEFLNATGTAYSELPGLRKYDVSERTRDQGKLLMRFSPGPVTIGLNGALTHDIFKPGDGELNGTDALPSSTLPATQYGLLDHKDAAAGIDLGWALSEKLYLDTYFNYEENKALQRSNLGSGGTITQAASANWSLQSVDKYQMTGIHANIGAPVERVTYRMGYDVIISRGSNNYIDVGSGVFAPAVNGVTTTGSVQSPSDTKYTKQDVTFRANVKVTPKVSVVLGYLFEKYDVSDWQNQNVPLIGGQAATSTTSPFGQSNNYLGMNLQNYVAHVGSILLKYKF